MKQKTLPTDKLLGMFAEYNPKQHNHETTRELFESSLLQVGWLASIGVNEETKTIVSGHGRVQAAKFGSEQSQEWYDVQWKRWCKVPGRENLEENKKRFTPEYWKQCPCVFTNLDLDTEKAALVRMNNTEPDAASDPAKIAAILNSLPKQQNSLAGFDFETARNFVAAYIRNPKTEETIDFEPKQYFEREDATVYDNDKPEELPEEEEVFEYEDMGDEFDSEVALANFNLDDIDERAIAGVNVDKERGDEVRIVLLITPDKLDLYKKQLPIIAEWLGMSTEGGVKKWRPPVVLEIVNQAYSAASKALGKTWESVEAEKNTTTDEVEDENT